MSYPITHVTVRDTLPPHPVMTIGHIYPIQQQQETVFSTIERAVDEEEEEIERWEDDGGDTETKVIKPRRGRRPKAAETAETK